MPIKFSQLREVAAVPSGAYFTGYDPDFTSNDGNASKNFRVRADNFDEVSRIQFLDLVGAASDAAPGLVRGGTYMADSFNDSTGINSIASVDYTYDTGLKLVRSAYRAANTPPATLKLVGSSWAAAVSPRAMGVRVVARTVSPAGVTATPRTIVAADLKTSVGLLTAGNLTVVGLRSVWVRPDGFTVFISDLTPLVTTGTDIRDTLYTIDVAGDTPIEISSVISFVV